MCICLYIYFMYLFTYLYFLFLYLYIKCLFLIFLFIYFYIKCLFLFIFIYKYNLFIYKMFFFIRGVRNRIAPLQSSPVHQTNKTPHMPIKKTIRLQAVSGLWAPWHVLESLQLQFTTRACASLVLLPLGHAGRAPSLLKEFSRQVGSSAMRCCLALIPAEKGSQGQPTWLPSPQNPTAFTELFMLVAYLSLLFSE